MRKLCYVSLMRLPSEKAHSLQIMQNCEALANTGYSLTLCASNRKTTPRIQHTSEIHTHYGVENNFTIHRLPVLDLYPLAGGNLRMERFAFYVVLISYVISLSIYLLRNRADIYYSRDEYLIYMLSFFIPANQLVYEAHLFARTGRGTYLQERVLNRAGHIITITPRLKADFIEQYDMNPEKICVAHDGIRAQRFANLPEQVATRDEIGWQKELFIVGFVGRLHMLNVDKGVGTLVDALATVPGVALALVGGPDDMAGLFREKWRTNGGVPDNFLYAGQVAPDAVPRYLAAFDVCAMPHPFTEQFAYYTSPLKLFEYMASGRALIASDLPGWSDVLSHEQNALLVPPSDADVFREAVLRLRDDSLLREKLAATARRDVMQHYTWQTRADRIQAHIDRTGQFIRMNDNL